MARYTLLEMVQKILSDMDAEPINSIGETTESDQIASIIEDTFYNIVSNRTVPEHKSLIKLTALSDSNFPSHFSYPSDVNSIEGVWYDKSDDGTFEYGVVRYVEPLEFLRRTDGISSDYTSVLDKSAGTNLRITNNKHPDFYTSFDDTYIVMDSYKSTVDTTLQTSKVRAFGAKTPEFQINDSFVPDIDDNYFPYLLAESKSVALSLLKGGPDPKVEQASRRQKSYIQNDRYKTKQEKGWSSYGRRG